MNCRVLLSRLPREPIARTLVLESPLPQALYLQQWEWYHVKVNFGCNCAVNKTQASSLCSRLGRSLATHHGYHLAYVHVLSDDPAAYCCYTGHPGSVCRYQGTADCHRVGVKTHYPSSRSHSGQSHPAFFPRCLWHHSLSGCFPTSWE